MTTRLAERALLAAVVLGLHALLLASWPRGVAPARTAQGAAAVSTLPISMWLLPAAPPSAVPPAAPARTDTPTRVAARRAPARATDAATATSAPAPESPLAPATLEPATPASPPLDLRLRLPPGTAGRGGLTEPAGSMRSLALNDPRGNQAPDPRQALPDAVAAAAKGDCLKGEYAGWGMGLLSVPFLAYHAAAGNCKPLR